MFTETITSYTVDGYTLEFTTHPDDHADAPWDREDGHGPVSDWRLSRGKAPGERPLSSADRHGYGRFYDFAEACRMARRDGWGVAGGQREGESARHYASRAAQADYDRLRAWCNDEWYYVGVAVTVSRNGIKLTGDYDHAVWGIESDAGAYLAETANDLAADALAAAREAVAGLVDA